tara:strand:- start:3840 stop:4328 length:489 start_codon:yes stop_codon:yes gene_type:complete
MRRLLVEGFQVLPRHAFAALLVAICITLMGLLLLNNVGKLADRTESSMATYSDGKLSFQTTEGRNVVVIRDDPCKRRGPRPANKCLLFFENGDNVIVTYDAENPSRTWLGPTPGGWAAVSILWGGIALAIFAGLWLVFTSKLYRRITSSSIAQRFMYDDNTD